MVLIKVRLSEIARGPPKATFKPRLIWQLTLNPSMGTLVILRNSIKINENDAKELKT